MTILRLAVATADIPPLPPFPDFEPDFAAEPDAATLAALGDLCGDVAPEAEPDALAEALSDLDGLDAYLVAEDAREVARQAEAPERQYVASWPILRRAIMRRGGIDTLGDYDREDIPGGLYRRRGRGKAYDLLGETLADATGESRWFEMGADAILAELRRAWSEWRALRPEPRARHQAATAPVAAPETAPSLPTRPAPVAPVLAPSAPALAPVAAISAPEPAPEPVIEWAPAPARIRRPLPAWARALAEFAVGAGLSAAILAVAGWLVALVALMAGALTLTPLLFAAGLAVGLAPAALAAGILAALAPPVAGPSPALVEEYAA